MKNEEYHIPVMIEECIEGLDIQPNGVYVDATYGGGGHSKAILNKLGEEGKLIAFDQDSDAAENVIDDPRLTFVPQNFRFMKNHLKAMRLLPVDGILADLGISSHQVDATERGFSTRGDAELDMRMNRLDRLTAKEIVNSYELEDLRRIFREYGELKNAHQLATHITNVRSDQEIATTGQLQKAISKFARRGKENRFYAQVFQALRIEVNKEMEALEQFLSQTTDMLKPGGRLVIMSYHSLEDRPVKHLMKTGNIEGKVEKDFYGNLIRPLKPLHSKPIVPSDEEIERNPRSRSAKLRIAERLP
ncbi:16S rRNA (cytosine(1402)-N(4))-methyltransferase RsmH [Halocola ammonii]